MMPAVGTQTNQVCSAIVGADRLKSALVSLRNYLEQLGTSEKRAASQPVLSHCRKLAEESLILLDGLCVEGTAATLREEALEESGGLAHISKSRTGGTCSVYSAEELQNDGDVGSVQSTSEDSEVDDLDILPALPPTEPGILRYHREQDITLHLPKVMTNAPVVTIGLDSDLFCEFCGSELVQSSSSDSDSSTEESSGEELARKDYCCHDRKRLCKLVSRYSRKLTKAATAEGARKIDVSPGKKARKEEAKRRALDKMRARRLQKQRELKLLGIGGNMQSSSFHSLARQTKTIAFSLSEPNAVQENWILDTPQEEDKLMAGLPSSVVKSKEDVGTSKMSNRQRRRRRRRKSLNEKEDEDDMASWLQQSCVEPSLHQTLKMIKYPSGIDFQICHSDGTGQCYYPSGNMAVLVSAMSPGILSHYVFPDDKSLPHVLAYFDDLGRGFSYYEGDQDLRLYYGPEGGMWLNEKGSVKKNWEWVDDTAFIQPLVLSLNANITLKVTSQSNITLIVSANPRYSARFSVGQKLTPPSSESTQKYFAHLEEYLKDTKAHVNSLLTKLQHAVRSVSRGSNAAKSGASDRICGNTFSNIPSAAATTVQLPPLLNTPQRATKKR